MDLFRSCLFGTWSSPSTLCPQVCDKVYERSSFLLSVSNSFLQSVSNSFLQSVSNPQGCTRVPPLGTASPCTTGALCRHTSVPTGVQGQCHAQPCPQRHSSHAWLHMAWTHSSGARTCSPRPGLQEPRAGDMSGVATAPSVPGCWHRDPEPSARPQLRGKHKHEAAPALAPHSKGFIYPNCQE